MKYVRAFVQVTLNYSEVRCFVRRSLLWQEKILGHFLIYEVHLFYRRSYWVGITLSLLLRCVSVRANSFPSSAVWFRAWEDNWKSIFLVQKHVRKQEIWSASILTTDRDNGDHLLLLTELGKFRMESWLTVGAAFQTETISQRIKKKTCETLNIFLEHALAANWWSNHPFTWNNLQIKKKVGFEK